MAGTHAIVVSTFHLLACHEPYKELGPNDFDEQQRDHLMDWLTTRIQRLGYGMRLEPVPAE
jgi:hypothetical protein